MNILRKRNKPISTMLKDMKLEKKVIMKRQYSIIQRHWKYYQLISKLYLIVALQMIKLEILMML